MRALSFSLAAALGLTVAFAAFVLRESWRLTNGGYVHPRAASFRYERTPMTEHQLPFSDVEFSTPSGAKIRGWLVPASSDPLALAIVTVHGRGADRTAFLPHLPMLHGVNATVVLIDLRENGLSDGRGRGIGLAVREAEDVRTVVTALHQRGYRRVVVYGCSLGASAAIIAAAHEPSIAGVIAESTLASLTAFVRDETEQRLGRIGVHSRFLAEAWAQLVVWVSRMRLGYAELEKPRDAIKLIPPRPILLIHGLRDSGVPPDHTRDLAMRAGPSAQTLLIKEAGHCNGIVAAPDQYVARIKRFFETLDQDSRQ